VRRVRLPGRDRRRDGALPFAALLWRLRPDGERRRRAGLIGRQAPSPP